MQFLSRVTPAAPDFQREQSAGSRLPYAHHVNDRVVRLRDGTLMLAIRMQGLLFETAETEEINYRKNLRDAMLRAIGSSLGREIVRGVLGSIMGATLVNAGPLGVDVLDGSWTVSSPAPQACGPEAG